MQSIFFVLGLEDTITYGCGNAKIQKPIFSHNLKPGYVLHPKYHVQAIFTSASRLLALKVVMGLKALNNAPNKFFAWFPLSPSSES
jgi:hypothetical protein